LALAPGTYSIRAQSDASASFYYANGYMNYPQTGNGGTVTIDAISTPEPGSLTLLGIGVVGIIGAASHSRRKRATANLPV
jgi:hypothetical protein